MSKFWTLTGNSGGTGLSRQDPPEPPEEEREPPSYDDDWDEDGGMVVGHAQCTTCSHYKGMVDGKQSCSAFEVIPWQIWLGLHDHHAEYPNDNGLRYTRNPEGIASL